MVHLRGPCSGVGELKLLRKRLVSFHRFSEIVAAVCSVWRNLHGILLEEMVQLFQLAILFKQAFCRVAFENNQLRSVSDHGTVPDHGTEKDHGSHTAHDHGSVCGTAEQLKAANCSAATKAASDIFENGAFHTSPPVFFWGSVCHCCIY